MTLSLKRNALWNAANAVVVRACGLLFWVLVARLVSAEELGELLILQTTSFTAIRLVSTGFATASTQYVATSFGQGPDATAVAARISLAVGVIASTILAVTLFLVADLLAVRIWHRPAMEHSLHLAALFAFFTGLAASFTGIIYGTHEFRRLSIVTMWANGAQLLLVPFLISYVGYLGAIQALCASQGMIAAGLAFILSKLMFRGPTDVASAQVARQHIWRNATDLMRKTVLAAAAHGTFEAAAWLALAFLVRQPDGLAQSAIYGVGSQWRQITLFVPSILMQVSLPAFATLTRDEENRAIRGDLGRFSKFMKVYLLGTAVSLAALGPVLLGIYGSKYQWGGSVFAVLQLTALLQGLQSYRVTEIQGRGRFDLLLAINVPSGLVLVFAAWQLSRFGAIGLAFAFVAAFVTNEMALLCIRRAT